MSTKLEELTHHLFSIFLVPHFYRQLSLDLQSSFIMLLPLILFLLIIVTVLNAESFSSRIKGDCPKVVCMFFSILIEQYHLQIRYKRQYNIPKLVYS